MKVVKYLINALATLIFIPSPSAQNLILIDSTEGVFGDATYSNGLLFFKGYIKYSTSEELWKTDCFALGTAKIMDFHDYNIWDLFSVNNSLFFHISQNKSGAKPSELWKSDGTKNGTVVVKKFDRFLNSHLINNMINVNGTLYFTAEDQIYGNELWKSDGTEKGTILVKDIFPGTVSSNLAKNKNFINNRASSSFGPCNSDPHNLCNVNGTLFFGAFDPIGGETLWKSDGTEQGTIMIKYFGAGMIASFVTNLTNVNGTLFFSVNDGIHGNELWKSDGTEKGTVLIKDIYKGDESSSISKVTQLNGILYFIANDGIHGFELWKSDGTERGTLLIKDICQGKKNYIDYLMPSSNYLYFRTIDNKHRSMLWKTDGTLEGTTMIKDFVPEKKEGYITNQIAIKNGVYFFTRNNFNFNLWRYNEDDNKFLLIKDIFPSKDRWNMGINSLTNFKGDLIIRALNGNSKTFFWALKSPIIMNGGN